MYTSSKSALLNRLEHLQDEVRTLERRNEIDCSCKPVCWCHDKPYSVSGISVLNPNILDAHLSRKYPFDLWNTILKPLNNMFRCQTSICINR